jgi:hypothetical protein
LNEAEDKKSSVDRLLAPSPPDGNAWLSSQASLLASTSTDSGLDEGASHDEVPPPLLPLERRAATAPAVAVAPPTTAVATALAGSRLPRQPVAVRVLECGRYGLIKSEGETFFDGWEGVDPKVLANAPIPVGQLALCKLTRERGRRGKASFTLTMESADGGGASKVVLVARREKKGKTARYLIAQDTDSFGQHLGKLKASNVKGSHFVIYDDGKKLDERGDKKVRKEVGSVHYTHKSWSNPRGLIVKLPVEGDDSRPMGFVNALPEWDAVLKVHSLKFNGRATEISVKNFKLVRDGVRSQSAGAANLPFYLRMGKVGRDAFHCDFRAPMTPLQAFAIALTSFEGGMC